MEVRAEIICTHMGVGKGGGCLPAHMLHRVPAGEDWRSEGWFCLCTPFCATLCAETSQRFPQGNFSLLVLSTLPPSSERTRDPWRGPSVCGRKSWAWRMYWLASFVITT